MPTIQGKEAVMKKTVFLILLLAVFPFTLRAVSYESIPNKKCIECHEDISLKKFGASVHGRLSCQSCHTGIVSLDEHEEGNYSLEDNPVNCGQCHEGELAKYKGSAHAKNDVSCSDCHGSHYISPVPKTLLGKKKAEIALCANCHEDEVDRYKNSIHAEGLLKKNNIDSPTCSDCHGYHNVLYLEEDTPHAQDRRRAFHTDACLKCHDDPKMMKRNGIPTTIAESYYESYHGKVKALGYPKLVAGCADCHDYHSVWGPKDPRSTVSAKNRGDTCRKCHKGASDKFALYIAHAEYKTNKYPLLHYSYLFMTGLLFAVFGFFWLHSLLWWRKSFWERRRLLYSGKLPHHDTGGKVIFYRRFTKFHIFLHILMMVSFLGLVFTGLPIKFFHNPWFAKTIRLIGGPKNAALIHRICAIATFTYFILGNVLVFRYLFFSKDEKGFFKRLFSPESLCPRWRDVKDVWGMLKWFFGAQKEPPKFDRWTYWEKFDFIAVYWGMIAIGLTGIMLWKPIFFTKFLPGWILNIAYMVHSDEALLAAGFIFTVHFFNTHYRPGKFPMDPVIFTGKITYEEMKEERPEQYERYKKTGKLEELVTSPPSIIGELILEILGYAALLFGLIYAFLMGYSFFIH